MKTIVWFRNGLRIHDHPALAAAAASGTVLPVAVLPDRPPTASDWWISKSLEPLSKRLAALGSPLVIQKGSPPEVLARLAADTGADALFFNGQIDPAARKEETELLGLGGLDNVKISRFEPDMMLDPDVLLTKSGTPFKVFGSFWKALQQEKIPWPVPAPDTLSSWREADFLQSSSLSSILNDGQSWSAKFGQYWTPGEEGSFERWEMFRDNGIQDYETKRDYPAIDGTSRLSGFLASGNMSIRALWHAVKRAEEEGDVQQPEPFLRQLAWREFAYYQLHHFPHITDQPLRTEFQHFPWMNDAAGLAAWKAGETGYPLVDAGMRELWQTGTMHNRVRMVAASFLVKHLLIDWRNGAEWFRQTLADYDVANNTLGWQWIAGSGFDAAPYFRIFNPTVQGEKFDPDGLYIRRWVPELAQLPSKFIHAPADSPGDVLAECGVVIGETYPAPIVDHKTARSRALAAYDSVKGHKERNR
ncbi:deoxyribodipyrimidine photo-lyase [Sporosarcina sp. NCCP-2716]|nr:deoxyribodipyrimidine photo-lyase [Sporosarcina sp. NCCP-2716]